MRMPLGSNVFVVLLASLALACSSSGGSGGGGTPEEDTQASADLSGGKADTTSSPDLGAQDAAAPDVGQAGTPLPKDAEQLCKLVRKATCEAYVSCGQATSADACQTSVDGQEELADCVADSGAVVSALQKGTTASTVEKFGACMADYAYACGKATGFVDECVREAFTGAVGVGDPCATDEECWPKAYCKKDSGKCPGACTSYGAANAPCGSATGAVKCDKGLYCENGVKPNVCLPRIAIGQACDGGGCVAGSICKDKVCTAVSDIVAKCPNMDKGAGCTYSGLSCSSASGQPEVCVVNVTSYGDKGAGCGDTDDFSTPGLAIYMKCKAPYVCDTSKGICVDGAPVGTPCDPKASICAPVDVCEATSSKCTPVPKQGEACAEACAYPFVCVANACIARKPAGEACAKGLECQSNKCTSKKCAEVCTLP